MLDNRGTEIEIGQYVCYNFMGEIAYGFVEKIVKKTTKNKFGSSHVFHIKRLHPKNNNYGAISKVQRPKNLMVVFEHNELENSELENSELENSEYFPNRNKVIEWLKQKETKDVMGIK